MWATLVQQVHASKVVEGKFIIILKNFNVSGCIKYANFLFMKGNKIVEHQVREGLFTTAEVVCGYFDYSALFQDLQNC